MDFQERAQWPLLLGVAHSEHFLYQTTYVAIQHFETSTLVGIVLIVVSNCMDCC